MEAAGGGLVETELNTSSPTSSQEFLASKEVLVLLRVTLPEHLGALAIARMEDEQILDYVQSKLDTDHWIAKADFVIPDQLEQLILDNMPVPSTDESSQEQSAEEVAEVMRGLGCVLATDSTESSQELTESSQEPAEGKTTLTYLKTI